MIQALAHVTAVASILAAAIPSWLAILLLLPVGASLVHLRKPTPITTLRLHADGRLEVDGPDGAIKIVNVHPHTIVLSFLIVLLYRQNAQLRSILVLTDGLQDADFRQLRIWLRWRSSINAQVNPL